MGSAAVCFRVRGRVLVCGVACIRGRIRGVLLRRLPRQSLKLVDEGGIGCWIEILNLRGDAIDLLDLYLAQSKRRERGVKGLNLLLHIRCGNRVGWRHLPRERGREELPRVCRRV